VSHTHFKPIIIIFKKKINITQAKNRQAGKEMGTIAGKKAGRQARKWEL
jgi:predicted transposase YdaD